MSDTFMFPRPWSYILLPVFLSTCPLLLAAADMLLMLLPSAAPSLPQWQVYTPEGTFPCIADGKAYSDTIARMAGPGAKAQWHALEKAMAPLQRGAALFPAAAIRSDPGALLTAARFVGPQLLLTGLVAGTLTVRMEGRRGVAYWTS